MKRRRRKSNAAEAAVPEIPKGESMNSKFTRSEEHTSELQSRQYLVCRLLLEKNTTHSLAVPFPLPHFRPLRLQQPTSSSRSFDPPTSGALRSPPIPLLRQCPCLIALPSPTSY